jgi:hypothetical protein
MKTLREEALNQIALKQKQRNEANSSLLNSNKRESVREQMKVDLLSWMRRKRIFSLICRLKKMNAIELI